MQAYDRHDYTKERRGAVDRLGHSIQAILTSLLEIPVGGYLRGVAVVVRYRDQSVRPKLPATCLESHDMKFVPFALVLAIPLSPRTR
jgi:hypothetical protein